MPRWLCPLIASALGCGAAPAVVPAAELGARGAALDGGALRPATLVYDGHHHGDHPTWAYRQTITIAATERAGRPVWRRTARYSDDAMAMTLELDRQTLQPVHSELSWNGARVSLDYAAGRITGVVEQNGGSRPVAYRHDQPIVLSDMIDLAVAALPLAPGYRSRISVLDLWLLDTPARFETRTFTVRVDKEDVVTVPVGALPVLVVAVEPMDGDARLSSVYHVMKTAPHYAVRMETIVNPTTVGNEKRSVSLDELVSVTYQP
jgi:hypothetical protein